MDISKPMLKVDLSKGYAFEMGCKSTPPSHNNIINSVWPYRDHLFMAGLKL